MDDFPHLARNASPPEIDKDYHSVNEKHKADGKKDHEIGLYCGPSHLCSSVNGGGECEIGDPGIGGIKSQR